MLKPKKGLLTLAAAATLALGSLAAPVPALAAEAADAALITGTFTYTGHDATTESGEMTDQYVYSDAYFSTASTKINEHLATMSLELTASSISSKRASSTGDWEKASQNLEALLGDLGFSGFETNDEYRRQPGTNADGSTNYDTMGVACAHKEITVDGEKYTLLAIVPRTSGYMEEWAGDFHMGNETGSGQGEGYHYGMWLSKNSVMKFAQSYVKSQGITGKVKVWTVGYSRGAGVANLLGAALVDNSRVLGNSTTVAASDVYAYCYGTMATVLKSHIDSSKNYNGIHNFFCDYDVVTMAPFSSWGYVRYGNDNVLNSVEKKAEFLGFLKGVNSSIYEKYTATTGSVDPDNFTVVTYDENFNLVPAAASEQVGQKAFYQGLITQFAKHVSAKEFVSDNYQYASMLLIGLVNGHEDEIAELGGLNASSSTAYTAAIPVLAWYLTDYYEDNPVLAQTRIADLYVLIGQYVDAQVAAGGEEGETWRKMRDEDAQYKAFMAALSAFVDSDNPEVALSAFNATMWECAKVGVWGYFDEAVGGLVEKTNGAEWATRYYAQIVGTSDYNSAASRSCQKKVVGPLIKLVAYTVFSTEGNDEPISYDCEQLSNLATLMANGSNLMRAHNNELMISWLRTSDSYYKGSGLDASLTHAFSDVKVSDWYFNSVEWAAADGLVTGYGATGTFGPNDSMTREQFVTVLYRLAVANGEDVSAAFNTNILSFDDAENVNSWAMEAMQWAVGEGIMQGENGARLNPQGKVSREQVATFLYRYAEKYGDASFNTGSIAGFADADQVGSWAAKAMAWAVGADIVRGVESGTSTLLQPGRNATRAEVVAMLQRYVTE